MDENIEIALKGLFGKIKKLWFAVFFGMSSLIILAVILSQFNLIDSAPVMNPAIADQTTMVLILLLAIAIFYAKKSLLVASKIKEKAGAENFVQQASFLDLSISHEKRFEPLFKCVQLANRYLMLVWFLADLIVLVAFVSFLIVPIFKSFLLYSVVGLYSMIINFPSFTLYKKIYNYLYA